MKRYLALLLCIVTVLSLCACTVSEENASAALEVGYARELIMPDRAVPLAGYGHTERRITTNFLDYLYATCIAFRWGDEIILWYTQDLINCKTEWVSTVRNQILAQTGVPGDHIMICSTHTHSGPDINSKHEGIVAYQNIYVEAMIQAAKNAIVDLAPGKLYGTKTIADKNFVRHYLMNDGTYAGDNFGDFEKGIVDHAAENDPEMLLVKVEREGDKKDILLMNWQAHPCNTGGGTKQDISADIIGGTREAVEAETDMLFAYFTGAAGNQNTISRIPEERKEIGHREFGQELCQIALAALPNLQPIEGEGIKITQVMFEADVNHSDEHLIEEARQVKAEWDKAGDTVAGNAVAKRLGLSSVFHASAILARPSRPQRDTMEINAAYIAGMSFITGPFEMFAATGVYIKENPPYDMTFICSCANDTYSYMPTIEAHDYGCYESYVCYFARGTAELLQVKYVELLEGLK